MRPAPPSSGHHGRITKIRTIVGFKFFETRYESGTSLPLHFHDRACLCVVVSGTFREAFPRRTLELNPRTIAFRPAGEWHRDSFGSVGAHCLVIELPGGWVDRVRCCGRLFDGPICAKGGQLSWLGIRLYNEYKDSDEIAPLVIEGLLLEIAGELSRFPQKLDPEHPVPRWLARAREAIHAQFTQSLRLQELADSAGVHPVHLAREFHRCYGSTVGKYVRKLRIEAACERLACSNSSLAEIALNMGFADQAHFSRTFRMVTGVSPRRYRLQQR